MPLESTKPTLRIAAGIEYNGTHFCGWQSQVDVPTVQDAIEHALSKVANQTIRVIAAGRTDSGVHAFGQVIHFDTTAQRSNYAWARGANTWLPGGISVIWAKQIDQSFNARFAAHERAYRYVILNRRSSIAVHHQLVMAHYQPLNFKLMHAAAQTLLGKHDFTAFRATACQAKTAIRELRQLSVRHKQDWIWIDAVADGFLHHMVRNLVGVLLRIGEGMEPLQWAREVLDSKDRRRAGATAPAEGLYLTRVEYDDRYKLTPPAIKPKFW